MTGEEAARARAVAVEQLISTGVYVAVLLGVSLAMTKRDTLTRAIMWARRRLCHSCAESARNRDVAEFRREVSDIEHGRPW